MSFKSACNRRYAETVEYRRRANRRALVLETVGGCFTLLAAVVMTALALFAF